MPVASGQARVCWGSAEEAETKLADKPIPKEQATKGSTETGTGWLDWEGLNWGWAETWAAGARTHLFFGGGERSCPSLSPTSHLLCPGVTSLLFLGVVVFQNPPSALPVPWFRLFKRRQNTPSGGRRGGGSPARSRSDPAVSASPGGSCWTHLCSGPGNQKPCGHRKGE